MDDRPAADASPGEHGTSRELPLEISDAVIRLHKQYVGRGPTRVRTYLNDDLVTCVLEGGFTQGERNLQAHGEHALIVENRRLLQGAAKDALVAAVEAILGRRVRAFMSAADPRQEMQVEAFVLAPRDEEWRRFRDKFEADFGSLTELALIVDDNRRYVDANRAACATLGVEHAELVGRRVEDFTPEGLRDQVPDMWSAFLRDGEQTGEYQLLSAGGDLHTLRYRAQADWARGFHLSVLAPAAEDSADCASGGCSTSPFQV